MFDVTTSNSGSVCLNWLVDWMIANCLQMKPVQMTCLITEGAVAYGDGLQACVDSQHLPQHLGGCWANGMTTACQLCQMTVGL